MIDTIKIYTNISKSIYDKIDFFSNIKTCYNKSTGEIFYNIVNDNLEGSYSSSLSVKVSSGLKYNFSSGYSLEIEGSLHKILRGYNAFNGFYNIIFICNKFIEIVESHYNLKLPKLKHWFLQRIDIAKCFDLGSNERVCNYINNLSMCSYARRKLYRFHDSSIYLKGTTTTLKIYNKLLEFKKHDYKKLADYGFNVFEFSSIIKGFVRFECEIHKKKLESIYNKKHIRILNLRYIEFEKVWELEFMKLLKFVKDDFKKVKYKEDVEERLNTIYGNKLGLILYNFYLSIMNDGIEKVKVRMSKSSFYRQKKQLIDAGIDFSQTFEINLDNNIIDFNPFDFLEVI